MRRVVIVLIPLAALVVASCASPRPRAARPSPSPATTAPGGAAAPTCTETPRQSVASFSPSNARPKLLNEGRLVAGVSADTFRMGSRNPENARIEGFDIDILREVARALFGNPDAIEFKVVNAGRRIDALEKGEVDIVANTMTITCERWQRINFSAEYLTAGQRLLVRAEDISRVRTVDDLDGRSVCVSDRSTAEDNLRANHPRVVVRDLPDYTDCLVAFQQGTIDAILSDDTIVAGFAEQDPYARVVVDGPALTDEPYGLGVAKGNVALVRYVNGVLERLRGGRWDEIHDRWLDLPGSQPPPDHSRPLP